MKRVLLTFVTLGLLAFSSTAQAQDKVVTGRVTGSDDGLPLPQVTVLIKGTTQGAPTDMDGNYRVQVPEGATLVFRYLGYITQEVPVGNQTVINIVLSPDATALGEVVVTAQGIARDAKSLGYSIGQVEQELIESRPEPDVARLLKGKVPGVDVITPGGFLGRQANIQIRGQSSATGNNNALVVVDGVYYDFERFQDLDPNNIADINVLKGLAASALYGQEGRNGVIIVTTRTSKELEGNRDFTLTINQQMVMNEVSNLPDFQNTYGQGADNFPNVTYIGNWGGRFDDNYTVRNHYGTGSVPGYDVIFPELQVDVPYQAFPDNVNDFFGQNFGSNTSINANAVSGKTSIGFSTALVEQAGYIAENNQRRLNLGTSINSQLTDHITLNTTFTYSENKVNRPTFNVFDRLLYLPRNLDIQGLPFENPLDNSSVFYRADLENPRWQLKNTSIQSMRKGFLGKVALTWNLNDRFSIGYRLGLDTYNTMSYVRINKGGLSNQGIGSMSTSNSQSVNYDHNILINANAIELTPDLELTANLGMRSRSLNSEAFGLTSSGQVVYGFFRHGNFTSHLPNGNIDRRVNTLSAYGQAELAYRDYMFLTLAGANDWGSQVEEENRSLFYPSASVSFLPTTVWESLQSDVLNYLKVRFGYGTSAGFPGPFQTRPILSADAQAFITNNGTNISTNAISSFQPNPDLKPERLQEFEFGIDSRLFNNKVDVDLSFYKRISKDQVLGRSLPVSTGFSSTVINAGRIDTKGLEAAITVYPVQSNDFTWSIINNFTAYETTVIDLPEEFINLANGLNFAIEGQPLNVFRLSYVVRDEEGNALINPEDGTIIGSGEAGLPNKVVGDPNPDFKYTMINSLRYKNFRLNVQFDYVHGGDIYSLTANNLLRRGTTRDTEDRDGTYIIPGYYGNPTTGEVLRDESGNKIRNRIQLGANDLYFLNTIDVNDNSVYDGTTLRIREINLSYVLPDFLIQKSPFKAADISFNIQNVWFRAFNMPKYMNLDTEVSSSNSNGRGFDTQADPTMRQYAVSLRLTL